SWGWIADHTNTAPRRMRSAVFVRVTRCSVGHDCIVPLYGVRHGAAVPYFFFLGTFAPERRASDSPMAIACLRLVTFLLELPERSVPRLRSRITFSTFFPAFLLYFLAITPPAHGDLQVARLSRDRHTCCEP